jgi:XTP/dITP diphosphohydrolase
MELLVATSNPHKLDELRAIFARAGIEVIGLDAAGGDVASDRLVEPVEDGATFADNARIKARSYARQTGRRCVADDSGLLVDALGGAPGVHSARYAGIGATRAERDRANNERLLRELAGVQRDRRTARFVCAMCASDPDGTIIAETVGSFAGVIADAPRGRNGFGYDPLLEVPALGRTSAELSPEEKDARSHRGEAARRMAAALSAAARSPLREG